MLVHAPMQRVRVIVLKGDADAVTEAVGRLGVVELTRASEETRIPSEPGPVPERVARCAELKARLESLMNWLAVPLPEPGAPEATRLSLDEAQKLVEAIEQQTAPVGRRLEELDRQIREAGDTIAHIAPYRDLRVPPRQLAETSFLHVTAGDMPADQIGPAREALPSDAVVVPVGPAVVPEGRPAPAARLSRVLAVSSRRSRFALRTVLEEHHFSEQELPGDLDSAPAAVHDRAVEARHSLQAQKASLQAPLLELGRAHGEEMRRAWPAVSRELRVSQAELNYASTWAAAIITGWAPRDQVERVRDAVARVTQGSVVFEARDATLGEIQQGLVPSYTTVPWLLRPFQGLVHGFGEPGYREIEPTILFAASFLLMFGVIFGDFGHGLCLVVIGALTYRLGRKRAVRDAGYVIAAAGLASALFGTFFQGALFGRSLKQMGWPLTLGVEPLRLTGSAAEAAGSVVRYLIIAVVLGIVLISIGVVLNIITRLRSGDYEGGLLGRFGLAGMLFYWGSLGMAVKLAVAGGKPADWWLFAVLVVLPLVVLALHEPIYALVTRRPKLWHESALMGLFGGVLEALEAVMTYLANTFSFLRVAAFALSHVALCFTVFVLQGQVERIPAGKVWSALVLVIGTAVIIGLEGLIVAIQIFRLEYYEFFTKFFSGEGKVFRPFRLDEGRP